MMAFPTVGFQGGGEVLIALIWKPSASDLAAGNGIDLFFPESSALELILNLSGRNISPTGNAIPDRNFDVAFSSPY